MAKSAWPWIRESVVQENHSDSALLFSSEMEEMVSIA